MAERVPELGSPALLDEFDLNAPGWFSCLGPQPGWVAAPATLTNKANGSPSTPWSRPSAHSPVQAPGCLSDLQTFLFD